MQKSEVLFRVLVGRAPGIDKFEIQLARMNAKIGGTFLSEVRTHHGFTI